MLIDSKLIEQITNFIREELKKPNSSLNTILDKVKSKFMVNTNNTVLNDIMILQIEKIIDKFFKDVLHDKDVCKPESSSVTVSDESNLEQPNPFVINTTPVKNNRYDIKFFVPGIPKGELILNHSKQHLTLYHDNLTADNSSFLLKASVEIGATVESSVYANGVLSVTIQLPTEKNIPIS